MPQSVRQRNLFAAEDFTVVYDSFRQANFKAYDYDTIKNSMVEYIQETQPESFNDWIQSSEFVALIELIAYLGHNLAFRADLASRENFLSTAERRESVLRLADFLGYKPIRNLPARGLLKLESVRTNQTVYGVDGTNLKNQSVRFFDANNFDSRENFISIMNEIFPSGNAFGRPAASSPIDGILTELYPTEIASDQDVVFPFGGQINGSTESFEIHSLEIDQSKSRYYESTPSVESPFKILYRDDRQGITSNSTGFFVGFKQGTLRFTDFNIEQAQGNLSIDVNSSNINNSDVWVQSIDSTGTPLNEWTRVGQEYGTNVIFNAISRDNRRLYSINTRDNDAISVKFGDGVFTEIPKNLIRVWYRNSLNETYIVEPDDLGIVEFSFDYIGKDNKRYRAKFTARLNNTVSNASAREDTESVRQNASRVHATQDRMVSGADYSVLPLTASANVKKIKSINRTYSGHSRFYDLNDPTGNYQSVTMFDDDGYIFTKNEIKRDIYNGTPSLSAQQLFDTYVSELPSDRELINFYYENYEPVTPFSNISDSVSWNRISEVQGPGDSGYLTDASENIVRIGPTGTLLNLDIGTLIEFIEDPFTNGVITDITVDNAGSGYTSAPTVIIAGAGSGASATASVDVGTGQVTGITVVTGGTGYTDQAGVVITGGGGSGATASATVSTADTQWTRITGYHNAGLGIDDSGGNPTGIDPYGHGAVVLSDRIPEGAKILRLFPAYTTTISDSVKSQVQTQISLQNNFGLRYNEADRTWVLIDADNLAPVTNADDFDLANEGATGGLNNDQSWLIRGDYNNGAWTFRTREYHVIFGSESSVRFYNENGITPFDRKSSLRYQDLISLLDINTRADGFGMVGSDSKLYLHRYSTSPDGYTDDTKVAVTIADDTNDLYPTNPVLFDEFIGSNTVKISKKKVNGIFQSVLDTDGDTTVPGRKNIRFKWQRRANDQQRIDPAVSSIIDVFVLTDFYDKEYRAWLSGPRRTSAPTPPTSEELALFFESLQYKKSMSDTVRYRSAKYKPLFGPAAADDLQATFKVVKLPGTALTDSEIKSLVAGTIDDFFALENWEFGESFYFTELATYIHNQNLGTLSSVIVSPRRQNGVFGELFQIQSGTDELFIPDVTSAQIEIVDQLLSDTLTR